MNYMKGSLLTVADMLSRAPFKNIEIDGTEITSNIHVIELNYLVNDFRCSNSNMEQNQTRL